MDKFWDGADRRSELSLREYVKPYNLQVLQVGAGADAGKVKVRIPGEDIIPTADLPWAPVFGAMPIVGDYVFTLVAFASRRVITSGGDSGPGQAIGAFSAQKSVAQLDVPDTTLTKVEYNTEDYDVSGWYDATLSRYTPLIAGYYRFSAHFTLNPAVASQRVFMSLYKNGGENQRIGQLHTSSAQAVSVAGSVQAHANGSTDYFEIWMQHTLGVGTSDLTASPLFKFHGELIGTD